MDNKYFLSESDLAVIKQLVTDNRSRRLNSTRRPAVIDQAAFSSDVYVARTPDTGIPALVDSTEGDTGTSTADVGLPGYANCQVYQSTQDTLFRPVLTQIGDTETVYNVSLEAIPANTWILIVREKFGTWIAVVPGGGGGGGGTPLAFYQILGIEDDYLICAELGNEGSDPYTFGTGSGTGTGTSTDNVLVAKPYDNQRTPWDGRTVVIDGVPTTYSYVDMNLRTATTAGGTVEENLTPPYFLGDVIAVMSGATDVVDCDLSDINTAGRSWIPQSDAVSFITAAIVSIQDDTLTVTLFPLTTNPTYSATTGTYSITGDLNTTTTVSSLSSTAGLYVGMSITGTGIPSSTTVASIDTGASTLVLSNAATTTASGVALTLKGNTLVAKPYDLQKTPWNGQTVTLDGIAVTYTWVTTDERTAAGNSLSETQYVTPPYFVGDILTINQIATGVSGATYADMNTAGRAWATDVITLVTTGWTGTV